MDDEATLTDENLVLAFRDSGVPSHLDRLFRRHIQRVRAMIYQMVLNHADADELTQEVFVRVVRHIDRFNSRACFSTWLYRITMNCTKTFISRRSRDPIAFHESPPEMPAAPSTRPDLAVSATEVDGKYLSCIRHVKPLAARNLRLETNIGGSRRRFPTTQWTLLESLRSGDEQTRQDMLGRLVSAYWKPIYSFVCRSGYESEDAKDIAQSFLSHCIDTRLFEKGDAARGRFRSFLLSALTNFVKNWERAKHAAKRHPPGGIVSLEQIEEAGAQLSLVEQESPADAFNRQWALSFLQGALARMQTQFAATSKSQHYDLFVRRVIGPTLYGHAEPSLAALAKETGLSPKEISNRLVTARRAYRRTLIDEIRIYAVTDEEVTSEVRKLIAIVAGGHG